MALISIGADGGILPPEEWAAADKIIEAAKNTGTWLEERIDAKWFLPGIGQSRDHYTGLLKTYQNVVNRSAETLERLKHGPPLQNPNAVADWKNLVLSLEPWAKEIDEGADFGSIKGFVKEVGAKSVRDATNVVTTFGSNTITAIKWAPWIALGVGAIVLYGFLSTNAKSIKLELPELPKLPA